MKSILFASKFGTIGAKFLTGAAIVKAAPFVVPVACAVVCMTATIAGAKYFSKKLSLIEPDDKEPDDDLLRQRPYFEDDYINENDVSDDTAISDIV